MFAHGEGAVSRRLKQAVVALSTLVVLVAAAQLIRPDRTPPATDPGRTIQVALGTASPVPAIVDCACGDCHSNSTVSSRYAEVAPLSRLMACSVDEGRRALNLSEWAGYPPDVQRTLLSASCDGVLSGKMPGPYTLFGPDTKQDIEAICAAAR